MSVCPNGHEFLSVVEVPCAVCGAAVACEPVSVGMERHEGALDLLAAFVDDEPCSLDHHGYCQSHGWLQEGECDVARARRLIGGRSPLSEPVSARYRAVNAEHGPVMSSDTTSEQLPLRDRMRLRFWRARPMVLMGEVHGRTSLPRLRLLEARVLALEERARVAERAVAELEGRLRTRADER